ncbi:hypothetical protein [Stappia sp.]|uniref:hypothetical protein n=1 Tax=Stappia sp. TaxID=1870903 RepID=UPI003A995D6E
MFKHLVLATVLMGVLSAAQPAWAAKCALRDTVVERLSNKYSEQLTAGGLQSSPILTTMVEVWASEETGTFTVILTNPEGVSCILAAGTDWFTEPAKEALPGTPS